MAARRKLERAEFDALTRQLVGRARAGRAFAPVPADAAEDVVQEIWTRLVRQPAGLPSPEELEAHANTTLRDAATDYWRSRTRKKDVPVDKLIPLERVPGESEPAAPRRDVLAAVEARRIREVLVSIVGPHAAYAVLDALDVPEAEIADRLGISPRQAGALRKQVSRSRAAIAAALGKSQPNETEAN